MLYSEPFKALETTKLSKSAYIILWVICWW